MTNKKILITGLFLNEENKHIIYRTAADQLAELMEKNNYPIIKTSYKPGRIPRLIDTCKTIFAKASEYNIAIVPFYGGFRSLVLEAVVCYLLKALGKKIVLVIHGGGIPDRMKLKASRYIPILKTAKVLVAPSNFLIEELKPYGLQIELIENVLNLKEYQFHQKQNLRPHIFWMRTFEDLYNPLMAVRVFKLVKEKYPEAKMLMAGRDAGMLQATHDLVNELQLKDSISFSGYVTNKDKNEIANEYDIYTCTNIIDNAPVSLIEMMSLGVAVVSTNAGGIPYLATDKHNALLVDIDDDKAMFGAIDSLMKDDAKAQQLIANGLQTAQQYDEQPVMKKWAEVLKRLG